MTDDQKVIVAGIAIGALLVVWFCWLAARAIRHRRPHGSSVTRAATKVLDVDKTGDRPEKVELTEHVAWLSGCDPAWDEVRPALGRRGYLALTRTHLVFVPYHRADVVVFERDRLSEPASKHEKVWKKARGEFHLTYTAPGITSTISFKVREPYTWLFKFGYRSGLADDPYSTG